MFLSLAQSNSSFNDMQMYFLHSKGVKVVLWSHHKDTRIAELLLLFSQTLCCICSLPLGSLINKITLI